ncbi:MAG TPA: PEP-CTERM sorting domain-containing protein [Thermoguttaceae bacterium]|nr:PEP-CTERM sorting domain-containing protein [Thermoguttaceae bacterium]HPP52164.1 PEP-CTERM sorting domain-containing protein [Thermoguttaceae bacterium]
MNVLDAPGGGQILQLQAALPEPSTWALALAGLAALAGWHFASSRRCRGQ